MIGKRIFGCTCGQVACICPLTRVHETACRFRLALFATRAMRCRPHDAEVCALCDPCTCREARAGSVPPTRSLLEKAMAGLSDAARHALAGIEHGVQPPAYVRAELTARFLAIVTLRGRARLTPFGRECERISSYRKSVRKEVDGPCRGGE